MLAGANPFRRESVIESLNAILKEEPPELGIAPSGANPALVRIVARLLEKDPARRFHSAHDLVFALEGSSPTASGVGSPGAVPGMRSTRSRWPSLLIALALLAAGLGVGRRHAGAGLQRRRPPRVRRLEDRGSAASSELPLGARLEPCRSLARRQPAGDELFYVAADGWLTAIEVGPGDPPQLGEPRALFPVNLSVEDGFDVTADGERFLLTGTPPASSLPVTVTLDWQARLPKG